MQIETIEIAKLELEPGDTLLVRVPVGWTQEQEHWVARAVEEALERAGVRAPVLVGTKDVDFQVLKAPLHAA